MKAHRDILVLGKTFLSEEQFQQQMEQLEEILSDVETSVAPYEIVDLNRFVFVSNHQKISKLMARPLKPFVFLINNN